MRHPAVFLSIVFFFCFSMLAFAAASPLTVWPVDPLVKVFRDDAPGNAGPAEAFAARGETADFQIALTCTENVAALRASVSAFVNPVGAHQLNGARTRFVGYVHVDRPTQKPSSDQLRVPPADYPDVLLEEETIPLSAGQAQPVWVSVPIPLNQPEGVYTATLEISADAHQASVPLQLTIYPIPLDKTRLWITNWFVMQWQHMNINPEPESEEYYALLRRYARNMAEHRQNVILISPLSLMNCAVDNAGQLTFDFSRFDRWVRIFQEEGVIGLIEGGHIGGRMGGWESQFGATIRLAGADGAISTERVAPETPEARAFYSRFFPALVAHLREQGWLDQYVQHLADEPTVGNLDSYRGLAALAREFAPELRIVEATHAKDLVGSIDVWTPQLNFWHNDYAHYQERQAAGDEVWFYTCVFPQGEYANRFIEQPLIKTRLLHWLNFAYNSTGYLHWGYNHWTEDDPTTHTTRPHNGPPYLPAGDPWVVYPGADGPLDSIRFEAMRDGAVDHELLSRLAEANDAEARALAARHILNFDQYDTDPVRFRETRKALLQAVAAISKP